MLIAGANATIGICTVVIAWVDLTKKIDEGTSNIEYAAGDSDPLSSTDSPKPTVARVPCMGSPL